MNGYDAQDMASQGADGFRNGYQAGYADAVNAIEAAQPAAAQEAVATVESYTNGSYHRNYKLRWHKDVDAGTQLFAAPVTAAPADAEEDAYVIEQTTKLLAEIAVIVNGPEPAGTRWSYHDLPAKVRALASTPAAPGIDLTPFRELADAWQKESSEALGQFPPIEGNHRSQMIRLGKCATKLHNLIDASPKGDDVAGTLRLLLDERNHRTDGDLKTLAARCLHLSRGDRDLIAMRGALIEKLQQRIAKDSPKGDSEALTSAARRIVEGARKKAGGGWWMLSPSEMEELRGALAQASDAEVPPLCDLCRKRPEAHSDAEGIGFCEDCWDAWVQANSHGAGDQG